MSPNIKCVGVIGTGTIGASWTGLFLSKGLKVLVSDPALGAENALASHLADIWPTLEEIGLAEGASLDNYHFCRCEPRGSLRHCGFHTRGKPPRRDQLTTFIHIPFQNAPERLDLKTKLIGEIDASARPGVIIASSSSGIPSSQFIGDCKKDSSRVLIGHPFNPPHIMPLVEVVPHPGTSPEAIKTALDAYSAMGKRPVLVKKETPGFAANRLQAALLNEAYSLVANDVLSATDVGKSKLPPHCSPGIRDSRFYCRYGHHYKPRSSLGLDWAVHV